ncbi:MAG TPA: amidohydrolase family protein [Rectinemataceae bacterium]|nr:amidohydrolase family protein [Rectinemataceae bacterium]
MASLTFVDVHLHALTLSHPSFLAFIETVRSRRLESLLSYAATPNYLISSLFLKTGERVRNMLAVMENDVGSIFGLMEDDLAGRYSTDESEEAMIVDGKLHIGKLGFDRLLLVPLIMDFSVGGPQPAGIYYNRQAAKPVELQTRDLLEGIRAYRLERPDGFLEIRPFLGIDTRRHDPDSLRALLTENFATFSRSREASSDAFRAMADYTEPGRPDSVFAGVKVYPPLGFDPWPDNSDGASEREKLELLWSFCEERRIPVTTHCDDQGFRVVPLEQSLAFTSPARWASVLERFPRLHLNFAHFGIQYLRAIGRSQSTEWTDRIVGLMEEYPNVYADFSFNGTEPEYYRWLAGYVERIGPPRSALILDRLMFGSDFMVNLSRIRSYADYYRVFADAPFGEEELRRFCHDNPERFLFDPDGAPAAG